MGSEMCIRDSSSAGQIRITLKPAGEYFELGIEDNGKGVKESDRSLLFKKFSSLSDPETSGGHGLGLLICASLANLNNSEAFYRPKEPTGSVFGLRFPKSIVRSIGQTTSKAMNESLHSVLVIEDHPETGRALKRQLESIASHVHHVSDLGSAKDLISKHSPSLVVSDFNLKGENVRPLLGTEVPWIIVTGDQDAAGSIENENVRVLSKPCLLYTSPSPRDATLSRMPSSA